MSLVIRAGGFPGAELVECYILHCFSFDVVNGVYIEAMIKPLIFDQIIILLHSESPLMCHA